MNKKVPVENNIEKINKELKILIVGDREVGKTSLSLKYFSNADRDKLSFAKDSLSCIHSNMDTLQVSSSGAVDQYIPTTLSVYRCDIKINSIDYGLSLTDTSGCRSNKKFVQLRKHYYTISQWYPEIREYYKDVPILLIGTKCDLKSQLKFQLKAHEEAKIRNKRLNTTKQSTNCEDDANTTITSNDTWVYSMKRKVNLFGESSSTRNNQSKSLANEFLATGTVVAMQDIDNNTNNVKQTRCNYCATLDEKQRHIGHRNLNNLTKVQIDTSLSPSTKPRTVSIVSKVSQQHIYDANTIFFNNNSGDQAEPEQQQKSIENLPKPEVETGTGLGLISLKTIPKIFTNLIQKSVENKAKTAGCPENEDVDEFIDDSFPNPLVDGINLDDLDVVDGLISNLRVCDDNVPVQAEKEENPSKNSSRDNNYSLCINNKIDLIEILFRKSRGCNIFNLCIKCQWKLDCQEKKILDSVAGKADEIANAANSILEETTESIIHEKSKFNDSNENIRSVPEIVPNQNLEMSPEIDIKNICQTQIIRNRHCLKLRNEIKAKKFMQCSSLDDYEVKDVMDTAIEIALEFHLKKMKKHKSPKATSTHQFIAMRLQDQALDSSVDSAQIDDQICSSPNSTFNDSMTKINTFGGIFKSSTKAKNKLSKKFSNSTEYSYTEEQNIAIKKNLEKDVIEIEKISLGIELPINRESKKTKTIERSRLNKNPSRSLSRCLSCTRGNNDTTTSLDKI